MNIMDITLEDLVKYEKMKADTRYDIHDKKSRKSAKLTAEKFYIINEHYDLIKERFDNNGVFKTNVLGVVKCPHCGYESEYSWDYEYGNYKCELCKKDFYLMTHTITKYTTTKEG